ncbi:DUF4440 domain-containing protein [bacterium]|nr:DUF4440 domain-containing protein [bacterium]
MKKTMIIAIALIIAVGGLAAAQGAVSDMNPDAKAMSDVLVRYAKYVEAGDAESWISLWDIDGVQLAPGAPMSVGKAAIWKNNKDGFGGGEMKFNIVQQEIVVSGWYGYIRGVYDYIFTPKGGAAMAFNGKYLTVFKKQFDGTWLIYRDTFNSDKP